MVFGTRYSVNFLCQPSKAASGHSEYFMPTGTKKLDNVDAAFFTATSYATTKGTSHESPSNARSPTVDLIATCPTMSPANRTHHNSMSSIASFRPALSLLDAS